MGKYNYEMYILKVMMKSVCFRLFVRSISCITQTRIIPMILGYPSNDVVLGLKGQRLRLGLGYSNTNSIGRPTF